MSKETIGADQEPKTVGEKSGLDTEQDDKPISPERRAELRLILKRAEARLAKMFEKDLIDQMLTRLMDEIAPVLPEGEFPDDEAIEIAKAFEPLFEADRNELRAVALGDSAEKEKSVEFTEAQIEHVRSVVNERIPKPEAKEQKYEEIRRGKILKAALALTRERGLTVSPEIFHLYEDPRLEKVVKNAILATLWDKQSWDNVEDVVGPAVSFLENRNVIILETEWLALAEEIMLTRISSNAIESRFVSGNDWMLIYSVQAILETKIRGGLVDLPISADAIIEAAMADPLNTQFSDSRGNMKSRPAPLITHNSWKECGKTEQLVLDTVAYRLAVDLGNAEYVEDSENGFSITTKEDQGK